MRWKFPHQWFRLVVVLSLFGVAFQFAIDDAAHRSLCCSYAVFQVADKATPTVWRLTFVALMAVLAASIFVGARTLLGFISKHDGIRPFVVDLLFVFAVAVAFYLTWTTAMGHAERWWAYGFKRGLIATLALWTVTLILTRRESPNWTIRGVLYFAGVLCVAIIPVVMVHRHTSEVIDGEVYLELHSESIRYGFAVLLASFFWAGDVLLSFRKALAPQPEKSSGSPADH